MSCSYLLFNKHSGNVGQGITLGIVFSMKQKVIYLGKKELNNETLDVVSRNPEVPSASLKLHNLLFNVLQENAAKNLSAISSHY